MFLSKVNSKLLKHLMVGCSALVLSLLVTYFFAKVEHDSVSSRRAGGMKLREVSQRYVEQIEVCAEGGFKYEVQHGLTRRETPRGVS